jgi:hypothetical protein
VRLRPNRGFTLGLALQRHPPNSLGLVHVTLPERRIFATGIFSLPMPTARARTTIDVLVLVVVVVLCGARHADTPTRRHADTPTRRHADTPTRFCLGGASPYLPAQSKKIIQVSYFECIQSISRSALFFVS